MIAGSLRAAAEVSTLPLHRLHWKAHQRIAWLLDGRRGWRDPCGHSCGATVLALHAGSFIQPRLGSRSIQGVWANLTQSDPCPRSDAIVGLPCGQPHDRAMDCRAGLWDGAGPSDLCMGRIKGLSGRASWRPIAGSGAPQRTSSLARTVAAATSCCSAACPSAFNRVSSRMAQ
jgi:hypothetical protein